MLPRLSRYARCLSTIRIVTANTTHSIALQAAKIAVGCVRASRLAAIVAAATASAIGTIDRRPSATIAPAAMPDAGQNTATPSASVRSSSAIRPAT